MLILISAPLVGEIADRGNKRKIFLMVCCYLGSILTCLLFFSMTGDVFYSLILFCLAQYCFVAGNVFYDSFLPFLANGPEMDRLSGQGYALGYLGGGALLALSFLFIQFSNAIGIEKVMAVRITLAAAGIWWAMFGTVSFLMFSEQKAASGSPKGIGRPAFAGLRQTWKGLCSISGHRDTMIFLIAYMIYNDGVQTVIRMASIYGKEELGLSTGTLLGTLLMVQFIGIGGALFMSWISGIFGARRTIMGVLVVWIGVTLYACVMSTSLGFWMLGVAVGLILGGTQALSRSFYGGIIPKGQSAQFFGYFSVFEKLSAIWGPILFAIIRQATGTSRLSILSLSLFFLIGLILLFFVRDKGATQIIPG